MKRGVPFAGSSPVKLSLSPVGEPSPEVITLLRNEVAKPHWAGRGGILNFKFCITSQRKEGGQRTGKLYMLMNVSTGE